MFPTSFLEDRLNLLLENNTMEECMDRKRSSREISSDMGRGAAMGNMGANKARGRDETIPTTATIEWNAVNEDESLFTTQISLSLFSLRQLLKYATNGKFT
jgi:hypothetical protein